MRNPIAAMSILMLVAFGAQQSVVACLPGDRHFTESDLLARKKTHLESNKNRGYMNTKGEIQFLARNADLMDNRFHEGLLRVRNVDGEYEFWNRIGEQAFPQKFENALWFQEDLCPVRKDKAWGFINRQGDFAIANQFERARPFLNGRAAVKKDGKWGYISQSGAFVIEPQFDFCIEFSEGLAAASKNGAVGFINEAGQFVIPPKYNCCCSFSCGVACVITVEGSPLAQHRRFIDKTGKIVFDYDSILERESPTPPKRLTEPFRTVHPKQVVAGQTTDYTHSEGYKLEELAMGDSRYQFSENMLPMQLDAFHALYLKPNGMVAFRIKARGIDSFINGKANVLLGDIHQTSSHYIDAKGRLLKALDCSYVDFDTTTGIHIRHTRPGGDELSHVQFEDKTGKVIKDILNPELGKFAEGLGRFGSSTTFPKEDWIQAKEDAEYQKLVIPLKKLSTGSDIGTRKIFLENCAY